ncbi:hypothetical protein ACP275_09G008600 [Erythranthe tilingii]
MMGKRQRFSRTEKGAKCADRHSYVDRLSVLPDDLLVYILSFLSLKEATMTSILSSRWRYLWTFIPKLDFNGKELLVEVELSEEKREVKLFKKKRLAYVEWVNHVLALHKYNSNVEEFKLFFPLDKVHKKSIGKWIQYALAGKVQRLELNFANTICLRRGYVQYYTFPYQLLRSDKRDCSWDTRRCNSIDFKCLKSILMKCVNVSGEALEFFLCNCPLLENLSVSESRQLTSLRISGSSSPSFKRLGISNCHNLVSVEIRDSNLVYLKYKGRAINFILEDVPQLVKVFVGGMITRHMEDILLLLSRHLPLLEIFKIDFMEPKVSWEETEKLCSAVTMSNLKQLVVKVDAYKDYSLLPLTNLIRASPCLQRFVVKADWFEPKFIKKKVKKITKSYKYVHLKEIEFAGYYGRISELELIIHLLENCVSLEKITVDPRDVDRPGLLYKEEVEAEEKEVRARVVNQLRNKVAPPVILTII